MAADFDGEDAWEPSVSIRRSHSAYLSRTWQDESCDEVEPSSLSAYELGELDAIHARSARKARLLAQRIMHIKRGCMRICEQLGFPYLFMCS